jgi:hypothetical protein
VSILAAARRQGQHSNIDTLDGTISAVQGLMEARRICCVYPQGRQPFDRPQADDPRSHQHEEPKDLRAHMLVGFVNIDANRAKCSLVAASRMPVPRSQKVNRWQKVNAAVEPCGR